MNHRFHDDRSVTLKDVAERAGVSITAVSAVLRGKSDTVRVSGATRERIIHVAREMRYRPHGVARALRRRKTDIIGFYSGYGYLDARNPFHSVVIGGLLEGCDRWRKNLLLYGTFKQVSPDEVYGYLADGRIDGLVMTAPANHPLVGLLRDSSLPTVAIVDVIRGLPSVVADEARGTAMIVDRLADRGHRTVIYRYRDNDLESANRRKRAFEDQCALRGIAIEYWQCEEITGIRDTFLAEWKRRRDRARPTAVVCWNDLAAYDVLNQCAEASILVPDELAVVGYDGVPVVTTPQVKLTTVRAPWSEAACAAVGLLENMAGGEPVPEEVVLPIELVCGDSA